jgi:ATP-dependent protease HslVU (ClpYQ) peptidase subunit
MTCIVGLKQDDIVYIGGDSAAVAGTNIAARTDEKIFANGSTIMGFMGSFRMGQLLRYTFKPPKCGPKRDAMGYLVNSFIDAVRTCYRKKGVMKDSEGSDEGGHFLLGFQDELYHIACDFQVAKLVDNYTAIGCGQDVALGALYATQDIPDPLCRIRVALEAATKHITGVCPPYFIIDSETLESRLL